MGVNFPLVCEVTAKEKKFFSNVLPILFRDKRKIINKNVQALT